MQIDGNRIIVANQTDSEWRSVEVWLNRYYRAIVPRLAAGRQLVVPLDTFVDGRARRFSRERNGLISDLRVKAQAADGTPVEVVKQFEKRDLESVFGGNR